MRHVMVVFLWLYVSTSITGCGVYLHDNDREKSAKEASEAFQKASAAALFDSAASDLKVDLGAGRAAVRRLNISRQDIQLVALIEGADSGKLENQLLLSRTRLHPADQMQRQIEAKLATIVGADATQKILAKENLDLSQVNMRELGQRMSRYRRDLYASRKGYLTIFKGTAPNTCRDPEKSMPPNPPASDSDAARDIYLELRERCEDLKTALTELGELGSFGLSEGGIEGNIRLVVDELADLEQRAADVEVAKQAIREKLKGLEVRYKNALADAEKHPGVVQFQAAVKTASKDVLSFLSGLESASTLIDEVKKLTSDAIDLSLLEAKTEVSPGFVGDLLKAEVLQTNLQSILSQAVDPARTPTTEPEKQAQAYYLLTLRSVDALAKLLDGIRAPEKLPSPNALLIVIAGERYREDTARLDEALVTGLLQAKRAQLEALRSSVFSFWTAHQAARQMERRPCGAKTTSLARYVDDCKNDRGARDAAARALVANDEAWSALVDDDEVRRAGLGLRQEYSIRISRANGEAWLALLKPALQELAAYGEGGIKPETIANLINALGLVGLGVIGWGVN